MAELKRIKKNWSILPLDCWGHVCSFLSEPSDFLSLCLTVKHFREFVNTNPFFARYIRYDFDLRMGQASFPTHTPNYVKYIEFSKHFLDQKLLDKFLKSFPGIEKLRYLHMNIGDDIEETKDDNLPYLEFNQTSLLYSTKIESTTINLKIPKLSNLKELRIAIPGRDAALSIDCNPKLENLEVLFYLETTGTPHKLDITNGHNLISLIINSFDVDLLAKFLPTLKKLEKLELRECSVENEQYQIDQDVTLSSPNLKEIFFDNFVVPITRLELPKLRSMDFNKKMFDISDSFGEYFTGFPAKTMQRLGFMIAPYHVHPEKYDPKKISRDFNFFFPKLKNVREMFIEFNIDNIDERMGRVNLCVKNMEMLYSLKIQTNFHEETLQDEAIPLLQNNGLYLEISRCRSLENANLSGISRLEMNELDNFQRLFLDCCIDLELASKTPEKCKRKLLGLDIRQYVSFSQKEESIKFLKFVTSESIEFSIGRTNHPFESLKAIANGNPNYIKEIFPSISGLSINRESFEDDIDDTNDIKFLRLNNFKNLKRAVLNAPEILEEISNNECLDHIYLRIPFHKDSVIRVSDNPNLRKIYPFNRSDSIGDGHVVIKNCPKFEGFKGGGELPIGYSDDSFSVFRKVENEEETMKDLKIEKHDKTMDFVFRTN